MNDHPIPFEETNPEACAMLVDICQSRGKAINDAKKEGKPTPKFKPITFKSQPKPVKVAPVVGRNDPCPCGALNVAGRPMKYKKCCGRW